MPDTPDAVRLEPRVRLHDALAEVYAGAELDDVDALLDQMTDRGLRVADLAVHVCPPCPHIQTSDEGTSYCDLAEHAIAYHCDEVTRLREALRSHGRHRHRCRRLVWLTGSWTLRHEYPKQPPCDCGLDAALAEGPDVLPTDPGERDVRLLHRVAAAIQNGLYGHGGVDPGTAACYSAAAAVLDDVLPTRGAEPNE